MGKIILDGKEVEFEKGETIYQTAKRNNVHIPVYCFHPNLRIVASCRICLVEVQKDKRKKLLPACATFTEENMEVNTNSSSAIDARKAIIEFLLLNHPVECPTCDQGGFCDLQNYSFYYGFPKSRLTFPKRVHKIYRTEPFIKFYPNRCIICDRCVRFYNEELNNGEWLSFGRGSKTVVGPFFEETFVKSGFAGYIIEICPVGAILDNTTYKFSARPWDLDRIESVCFLCSSICDTHSYIRKKIRTRAVKGGVTEPAKKIYDIRARDGKRPGILCDIGKFAKDFNISEQRLLYTKIKAEKIEGGEKEKSERLYEEILALYSRYGESSIALVISPRDTNENARNLKEIFVEKLGIKNIVFYPGIIHSGTETIRSSFTLDEIGENTVLLHFGYDFFLSHPVIGFEILRRVRKGEFQGPFPAYISPSPLKIKGKLPFLISFSYTKDKVYREADISLLLKYNKQEEILYFLLKGFYNARRLSEKLKREVLNWEELERKLRTFNEKEILHNMEKLNYILEKIISCKKLVIIFHDILPSSFQIFLKLITYFHPDAKILILRKCSNTEGFLKTDFPLISFSELLEKLGSGLIKSVFFYRINPFLEFPLKIANEIFEKCEIVVFDAFQGTHTQKAETVVPLPTLYEQEGTLISNYGEEKKLNKILEPPAQTINPEKFFGYLKEKIKKSKIKEITEEQKPIIISFEKLREFKKESMLAFPLIEFWNKPYEPLFSNILSKLRVNGVRMSAFDMEKNNIKEGEEITIKSKNGSIKAKVFKEENVPKNIIAIPFPSKELNSNSIFSSFDFEEVEIEKIT